eukprot:765991-Heterocapsa_arctica.AAC.1
MLPIDTDNWLCVRPTIGDAHGDVSAPQKFISAFDAAMEPVINDSRTLLTCSLLEVVEPVTNEHATIDHVRFADYFAQVTACTGVNGAQATIRNCNKELDAAILPANLYQNKGKQHILTHFCR